MKVVFYSIVQWIYFIPIMVLVIGLFLGICAPLYILAMILMCFTDWNTPLDKWDEVLQFKICNKITYFILNYLIEIPCDWFHKKGALV